MKLSNLLFLVCFITKLSIAQTRPVIVLNQGNKDTIQEPNIPDGNMPNSLKNNELRLKLKLKGNNQLGFDIYESSLDKMMVLIPDSANRASLGMVSPSLRQLAKKGYPSIQQNKDIPLVRPSDDSSFILNFNQKPFNPKKEQPKKKLN
ncbi:MAG: hypothetical protein WCP74_09535 [Sphingobacteriia bacterium]|jgi:hypothetical protein